jgi:hypothetical protein
MKIAIDFDSTIHNPFNKLKGYKMGQPIAGAVEAIQGLHKAGHTIIIFPVWADTEQKRQAIVDWLTYFKIPFDDVTSTKPDADVYIDDRAYRFENWQDTVDFVSLLQSTI